MLEIVPFEAVDGSRHEYQISSRIPTLARWTFRCGHTDAGAVPCVLAGMAQQQAAKTIDCPACREAPTPTEAPAEHSSAGDR